MTEMIKRHGAKMFLAGFAAGLLVFTLLAFSAKPSDNVSPREVVLIAQGIAFRLADQPEQANPPLKIRKGETVKLVIRNEEPNKVLHCFIIGGLNVKTSRELATGESETLVFTPKKKGVYAYACLLHPMMAGKITVE